MRFYPMKKLLLLLTVCTIALGCACAQKLESTDHFFTIKFPEYMTVFSPTATKKDDPALAQNGIDYETLTAFGQEGGVFYVVGEQNGVSKEITVNVQESSYTQELWELKKADTDLVSTFQDELIETFNVSGITVKQKGQFTQGRAYCVYLNIISGNVSSFDTVYMATIYNGKQYSILYQSTAALTGEDIDECHDMFDTFYITKTLPNPAVETKDPTKVKAFLVVILIAIAILTVVMVLRMFAHRKKQKEEEKDPYVPQFADAFDTKKQPKEKRK